MTEQQVLEFVVALIIGAAICLGKYFLMQRYFMQGSTFITMLLSIGRFAVDVAVMIAAAMWSMAALLGMAAGLVIPLAWTTVKALNENASSNRKR